MTASEESADHTERPLMVPTPSWGELLAVLLIAVYAAASLKVREVIARVR